MKKIVILGGGTAGWLTAMYIKQTMPDSEVTVIQNKKVGIIGVGEATTPPFVDFLKILNINPYDFLREVGGTIKNGISFENWSGTDKKYFHPFKARTGSKFDEFKVPPFFGYNCMDYYIKKLIHEKLDLNDYDYSVLLSCNNKVDPDNIVGAFHFDTNRASEYFEKQGVRRGIRIVNDNFTGVEEDDNGFITAIKLDNVKLDCDFVFDCSGLARLIIGKHYHTEWYSYKKHLPMSSAIPFYLENGDNIKPYTLAIAMPHGWMWQIPLQHRVGAGYVFDANYITAEQAKQEAEEYLGQTIEVSKVIKFESGRFEQVWVKNCIAVGLSAGFIEPLESSSIHIAVTQLQTFAHFINHMFVHNENSTITYNTLISQCNDEILNFIYLHYLNERTDTAFWRNFKADYPPPENIKHTLALIQESNLRYQDTSYVTQNNAFNLYSYLHVCQGLNLFKKPIDIFGFDNVTPSIAEYKNTIDESVRVAQTHNEFLKGLYTI